jgi:hypothetical protein
MMGLGSWRMARVAGGHKFLFSDLFYRRRLHESFLRRRDNPSISP